MSTPDELERLERILAGAACSTCNEPAELLATAWHHRDEPVTPHEVVTIVWRLGEAGA